VNKEKRRELRERIGLIRELSAEVDRQRVNHAGRASAMTTRLSILVAAASVTGSLQIGQASPSVWYVIGTFLAGAAALLGAAGLWPVSGSENGVEGLRDELWDKSPEEAEYTLMDRKLEILRDEEKLLGVRAWLGRFGFAALAFSIVAIAFHLTRII
jgi:hypothetical protein